MPKNSEKMYSFEQRTTYQERYPPDVKWRFYSLFNGMRGAWGTKEAATLNGERHQEIVESLYLKREGSAGFTNCQCRRREFGEAEGLWRLLWRRRKRYTGKKNKTIR